MKNYLIKLKNELVFYLSGCVIAGILLSSVYLFYNPVLYKVQAEVKFSNSGRDVLIKEGLANEPENIFKHKALRFISKKQIRDIELDISSNYDNLFITVKGENPSGISKIANSIAQTYRSEIVKQGKGFLRKGRKQATEQIDVLYEDYQNQLSEVGFKLSELEPQFESLMRKYESAESLRQSLKNRITKLEIKKTELLRIYTESHPSAIGIEGELNDLKERLESLPIVKGLGALKRNLSEEQFKYNDIQAKMTQLEKERDELYKTTEESLISIAQYAARPRRPIGDVSTFDVYKRFILGGLLFGFLVSLIAAAVRDTIVSECDFGIANVPGLPLLATVPSVKPTKEQKLKDLASGKKRVGESLIISYDDSSAYVNAYRSLATHVKMDVFKDSLDKKVILVTSPTNKTDKASISANLAIILARLGKKVVLIDANLNRTSSAKLFGIRAKVFGMSDVLSGRANLEDSLKGVTDMLLGGVDWNMAMRSYGLDRLKILPSGKNVSHPAGLLESGTPDELFRQLREEFDCIIIDAPALLKSPDAILLSPYADALFLVSKTSVTSYRDVVNCNKKLAQIKINFKGSILVCT